MLRFFSLLQSLSLHLIAVLVALLWMSRPHRAPVVPPPSHATPFEVSIRERAAPRGSVGDGAEGSPKRAARPAAPPKHVQLSDLGLSFGIGKKDGAPKALNPGQELGVVDQYFSGRTNGMYQEIRARIENALFYPKEFQDAFIEGFANTKLVFSKEGLLQPGRIHVESSHPMVRVLVMRVLRQAFEKPLSDSSRQGILGREATVDCYFRLAIMEGNDEELRSERNFTGAGHLSFFRIFHHSKLQWELGPLGGLGPIGVGINPDWFAEKYKQWIQGKAKIDPLDKWRDDPDF